MARMGEIMNKTLRFVSKGAWFLANELPEIVFKELPVSIRSWDVQACGPPSAMIRSDRISEALIVGR